MERERLITVAGKFLFNKTRKWSSSIFKNTNVFTYFVLLAISIILLICSLNFDTSEKQFTILSSLGCGGIASVIVAWLVECSNIKINKEKNKAIINQLLNSFDLFVEFECQRAISNCCRYFDMDVEKNYSISEIKTYLNELDSKAVYFKGFPAMIEKGISEVAELSLLNFDQTDLGRNLYDLFQVLKSTTKMLKQVTEFELDEEVIKLLVIQCFGVFDDINKVRKIDSTYSLPEDSKKYIKKIRETKEKRKVPMKANLEDK